MEHPRQEGQRTAASSAPGAVRAPAPGHARAERGDRLFRHLFGSPERRGYTAGLLRAVEGVEADPATIRYFDLDNAIFGGGRSDVAFQVGERGEFLILWEHQSTHNPNMALRGCAYLGRLLSKLVDESRTSIYGSRRIPLPSTAYSVFFAGRETRPEREVLLLSDHTVSGARCGSLQVRAEVYNVNRGFNRAIMETCPELGGYAELMAAMREMVDEGAPVDQAVDAAVRWCIRNGHLAEYLESCRTEACEMLFDEFEDEKQMRKLCRNIADDAREEGIGQGRAQGIAQGREEGREEFAFRVAAEGGMAVDALAGMLGITAGEFVDRAHKAGFELQPA